MSVHTYSTRFYRLSVDGLEGDATKAGLQIMRSGVIDYRHSKWAITNAVEVNVEPRMTAALLTRSRRADLMNLTQQVDGGLWLEPQTRQTYDFIPIVFYHGAHAFAIPEHQRFGSRQVIRVLKSAASNVLARVSILPLLNETSIMTRLRAYRRITELTITVVRENPESKDDAKLLTGNLEGSHVQRELLRLYGDPRGLNIDGDLIRQHLGYVADGYGEIKTGKAVNEAGNVERISSGSANATPYKLEVTSRDEPESFAKELAAKKALPQDSQQQTRMSDGEDQ